MEFLSILEWFWAILWLLSRSFRKWLLFPSREQPLFRWELCFWSAQRQLCEVTITHCDIYTHCLQQIRHFNSFQDNHHALAYTTLICNQNKLLFWFHLLADYNCSIDSKSSVWLLIAARNSSFIISSIINHHTQTSLFLSNAWNYKQNIFFLGGFKPRKSKFYLFFCAFA